MRELLQGVVWRAHLPGLLRLLVTFALLLSALGYNLNVRSQLADAEAQNSMQRDMVAQAVSAQALLDENLQDYHRLEAAGLIGDARRLEWIEAFRGAALELELRDARFTLSETRLLEEHENALWRYGLDFEVTPMRLDLQLAHEGDFYRLMERLAADAPGVFSVDTCKLDWLQEDALNNSLTRLHGLCELNWYTVADVTRDWNGEQ